MSKHYIALKAIEAAGANGAAISIEPRSDKHSGLFEHDFDEKTEQRLLGLGAIRFPEGTEKHEQPTRVETLIERAPIEGKVTEVPAEAAADAPVEDKKTKGPPKKADPELLG